MTRLHIHACLEALKLHSYVIDISQLGQAVYQRFEAQPLLPGAILTQQNTFVGMISRRRFLEAMSRAYGRELFLRRPLSVLYQFSVQNILSLPAETLITEAARQAIARPSELLYEPIVVVHKTAIDQEDYSLLHVHDVLQAQSTIHQLTVELLQEKTRTERMQTEKLASLGKMMAGVAHEIRNPVNFIWGNLKYVSDYAHDLTTFIRAVSQDVHPANQRLKTLQQDMDLEFVLKDLPKVIQSMSTGTERLRNLVTSLRTFSRMDESQRSLTDIHHSLDSTLLILNNRLKGNITVQKAYGQLPEVQCYSGQIGQVFMNIISNAIDALLEYATKRPQVIPFGLSTEPLSSPSSHPHWEPCITIQTRRWTQLPEHVTKAADNPDGHQPHQHRSTEWVSICIRDNGPGIPANIQSKIFDDFFTTKPSGEGTGLGLSISRQIVTEKHQGYLLLTSPCGLAGEDGLGLGTEFEIVLPVCPTEPELLPRAPLSLSLQESAANVAY